MVDGQYKIGVIVQARLGSTRLPNKVLMPLPVVKGKPILEHIFSSLRSSTYNLKAVLATSVLKINDELESFAKANNFECYRGSEENVLDRFYQTATKYNFTHIVRLTGDNPIVDTKYLDKVLNELLSSKKQYLYTKGLPLGCNFEVFTYQALEEAYENATTDFEKEHVTPYIKNNNAPYDFKIIEGNWEDFRFTVDYPSDYAFMNLLFSRIQNYSLDNFVEELIQNKWLTEINSGNYQKKELNSLKDEIDSLLPILMNLGLDRINKKLKELL